jgi:hypothetical protein
LKFVTVEGDAYVCLRKADRRLQEFLGKNFAMIEKLSDLRNDATVNMMDECDAPGRDPSAVAVGTVQTCAAPKLAVKRKREVFKELALGPIEVKVETVCGSSHVIKVLPRWHNRACLQMEALQENFGVLLLTPRVADAADTFKPTFEHTSRVKWNHANQSVYCAYWKGGKWKRKTRKVERGADDAETQSRVDDAALKLEEFWRNNHEDPEGSEAGSVSEDE